MSEASQRGGAPKGNRNAYKGKAYYPKRLFGQKWEYATGAALDRWLSDTWQRGQMQWLKEHLLPFVPPLPDEPAEPEQFTFKINKEGFDLLKASGKLTPDELARFVIVDD